MLPTSAKILSCAYIHVSCIKAVVVSSSRKVRGRGGLEVEDQDVECSRYTM